MPKDTNEIPNTAGGVATGPDVKTCGSLPSNPNERILTLYTTSADDLFVAPGPFSPDGRQFFRVKGNLCGADGQVRGRVDTIMGGEKGVFHDFQTFPGPSQLPQEPYDQPPADEWNPADNWAKAKWTLEGEGELWGVGRGLPRTVVHGPTGTVMLFMAMYFFITGGSGDFEGARGMGTSMASVDITSPPQPGISNPENVTYVLKILPGPTHAEIPWLQGPPPA